jgi:hypothetical protein
MCGYCCNEAAALAACEATVKRRLRKIMRALPKARSALSKPPSGACSGLGPAAPIAHDQCR